MKRIIKESGYIQKEVAESFGLTLPETKWVAPISLSIVDWLYFRF